MTPGMLPLDLHRLWDTAARACFSPRAPHRDSFALKRRIHGLDLIYISGSTSLDTVQTTRVHCRMHPQLKQLWVCDLQIAEPFRARGLGSELVQTIELFSRLCKLRQLCVFPLVAARRFWMQRGYEPVPGKYRLLKKDCVSFPVLKTDGELDNLSRSINAGRRKIELAAH